MNLYVLLLISGLIVFGCQKNDGFQSGKWVDLSYEFSSETIYWPTAKTFHLEVVFADVTEKGYYYSANNFSAAEHGGTHIDAPIHFAEGKNSLDQIPFEKLIGNAVVVDVSEKALQDPDYLVQVDDFKNWEVQNGKLPKDVIVLLRTGYGRYWPDRTRYMGTAEVGEEAVSKLHFPGLHPEAARWLVENRKIAAIGLDTASIDYGQSTLFESHQILFERNIPAFENLANLDKLPKTGAFVIALPMKIKDGSGGPLGIVAFVPED
jgi:kynurenine formamidase